jgi:ATP-dependent DNA ligase
MRLAVRREAFTHPDWIFEIKYDGFRSLARVDAGQVELISRRRNVYKSFVDLCADLNRALAGRAALLDGEIVCLDLEDRFNRRAVRDPSTARPTPPKCQARKNSIARPRSWCIFDQT